MNLLFLTCVCMYGECASCAWWQNDHGNYIIRGLGLTPPATISLCFLFYGQHAFKQSIQTNAMHNTAHDELTNFTIDNQLLKGYHSILKICNTSLVEI